VNDGPLELCGQIGSLIEASCQTTPRVQRYGDHTLRIRQQITASLAQSSAQLYSQGSTSFVFERMNDVPERAVVAPERLGSAECVYAVDCRLP
jgi:hypothetical protein